MDLSNMSSAQLRDLQTQLDSELKKREGEGRVKAREEILAIVKAVGVPLNELIGNPVRVNKAQKSTGTVAARYRNPADAAQQWTGRGRQPKWVKEWVDSGKELDGLRI